MSKSFLLPDLGEGVHEAEILSIAVSVGQSIREGDPLLEVETDKAAVEIPSPFSGVVSEILVKQGDMATVGDTLIIFTDEEESIPPIEEESPKTEEQTNPSPADRSTRTPIVPAAPSTRRLARDLGVDLSMVTPSGAAGVVTKEDVTAYAQKSTSIIEGEYPEKLQESAKAAPEKRDHISSPSQEPESSKTEQQDYWGPTERIPFRSIRRATATQMVKSWTQIPHVHCQDTVDITDLETFRQRHKDDLQAAGGKLTVTVFAMKAVATALKNYPSFNASLDLESQEIILKHYFNLGLAVDTDNGLMVPVIKDVDRKSIKELAIEVNEAITKVRTGTHSREQMQGGTFTITNVGGLGGHQFSAIINHPEVAILGMGEARMQPAVVTNDRGNNEIVPRLQMPIVLCFDHRVVDGADAIRFLRVIIDALEDPDELLITMI